MHIVFVHKNFPAQFGYIAAYLIRQKGWQCTFVSETPAGDAGGIRKIQYRVKGSSTMRTHYCARTFENGIWHSTAVYEALRPLKNTLKPDLIVGHSGFGSTLFLRELFPQTPIINYFEYFYRSHNSDIDFRKEWPAPEINYLRSYAKNAMILLDLENCNAGYSPTQYQHSLMPARYRDKVRPLHDGIDMTVWRRLDLPERKIGKLAFDPETRIVTYVSRGFQSMRGFDIFMKTAKRIYEQYPKVAFLVVGTKRVCYGGDLAYIKDRSFFDHVLKQDKYDLSKFFFVGRVPPSILARILSLSDLHIYLTVPFVLSWSMMNAMACGCVVLGSNTPPVAEMIQDGANGLLCEFYDAEGFATKAVQVLKDPSVYRPLGEAAAQTIKSQYSFEAIMPKMLDFYSQVAGKST